jgi:hypothetical protein
MIAAAIQRNVDRITKWSHYLFLKQAKNLDVVDYPVNPNLRAPEAMMNVALRLQPHQLQSTPTMYTDAAKQA